MPEKNPSAPVLPFPSACPVCGAAVANCNAKWTPRGKLRYWDAQYFCGTYAMIEAAEKLRIRWLSRRHETPTTSTRIPKRSVNLKLR